MPRYQGRHRAPGRHKAKRGPLASAPPWARTFAAVTSAGLGVSGVVGGGMYVANGLQADSSGKLTLADSSKPGSVLGARAMGFVERDRDRDKAVSRSKRRSLTSPKTTTQTDQLLTVTDESVIDRSGANSRREKEAEVKRLAEIRKQLESADPRTIARGMLAQRGWSDQFGCLNSLWNRESRWNTRAANPSGAYGIPQAKPGSKMASAGSDWEWNPRTQIEWGLGYISGRYGDPCGAWAHSQATGWY